MSLAETYFIPVDTPDLPEIGEDYLPGNATVHFEFGMHEYAEHFDNAAERMDQTDIYIPECRAWPEGELKVYQRLAKATGDSHARLVSRFDMAPGTYSYALTQAVKPRRGMSNLVVRLIDISAAEQKAIDRQIAPHMRGGILESSPRDFETAINLHYECHVALVNDALRRRKIMLERLGPSVTHAVAEVPSLVNKEAVRAMVTLGSAHKGVYEHLADSPHTRGQVTMYEDASTYQDETIDYVMNTLEPKIHANQPVSRDEVRKLTIVLCLTDDIVEGLVQYPTRHNLPAIHFKNLLFKLLTDDVSDGTAEMVFRLWRETGSSADRTRIDGYANQARELANDTQAVT